MKKYSFAVLAVLGIVLGGLTLAPAAHAVYMHANGTDWVGEPNG